MSSLSTIQNSLPPHLFNVTNPATAVKKSLTVVANTFVWPSINNEEYKASLDNYHSYIDNYNNTLQLVNDKIEKYNKEVSNHLKNNPFPTEKEVLLKLFTEKYSTLDSAAYNKQVLEFESVHGTYFKQRKFTTVKPVTKQVFGAIIHAYQVQLNTFCKIWRQVGKIHATTLPKVKVHPYEISKQQRNGALNLDVCPKTIRRHRDRLLEAGVLQQRTYHGTSKPCEYVINPTILAVFDTYNSKTQNAKNQTTSPKKRTECPHNKVSTSTIKNKDEIKGIVNNPDIANGLTALLSKTVFYKSTQEQGGKSQIEPPTQKSKLGAKNSPGEKSKPAPEVETQVNDHAPPQKELPAANKTEQIIKNHVLHLDTLPELAEKLANGEYNFYTPIKRKDLQAGAQSPHIYSEDYRDLVLQDFIKSSAHLWKNNQGGIGSWTIAIRYLYEDYGTQNFAGKPKTKDALYAWSMQYRYRLQYASKWFTKKQWDGVRFPSDYFDPLRTNPNDVCFAYTKKVWNKKMDKIQKDAEKKRKRKLAAITRKNVVAADRKLDRAVRKYLNNTYTLDQLTSYVAKLPLAQRNKLGARVEQLNLKRL